MYPFSEQEIREITGLSSVTEVFSWRSTVIRKLGIDPWTIDDEELIGLMLKEPRLIRRPLIRTGAKLIIGANPKELSTLAKLE